MLEWKDQVTKKEKTLDSPISSTRLDYPAYLDNVKQNLSMSLPKYNILIVEKQIQELGDQQEEFWAYSLILTSAKVFRQKFQIFTEAFLNQSSYCFYVRHLITLNHLQLTIQNKQCISMAVNLCNKINKQMGNFKLNLDPVSGKISFETKSFINESSFNSLKKNTIKQDSCFYSEIIYSSTKSSEKYIDLILFILGQLSLSQLTANTLLSKQFSFFQECQQIIKRLQKNIFYIPFLNIMPPKHQNDGEIKDFYNNLELTLLKDWKSSKQEKIQREKEAAKRNEKILLNAKSQILNNSLQFFSSNSQKILKFFTQKNPYQNIDFSVKPLKFGQRIRTLDKSIIDSDKKSEAQSKRILSLIEVVHVEGLLFGEDQNNVWKKVYQGGFGIIETATIKYRNISSSQKQAETGFSLLIKQQMIRKRDKNKRKNKIQRQRNILQKLKYFSHPNIMNFYISFQVDYQKCIFSDYLPNMSLDLYLKKNEYSVNFSQKLSFLIQAIEGLIFLHEKEIVHLDVKPGNMLINKKLSLMISDFGEAFVIGENDPVTHNHAYTIPYCAPQIFKEKAELTKKVDIYAIGVCIFKVVLGEAFFDTFLQKKFVKRLCNKDLIKLGILQKYQKSFIYCIIKIIMMIAHQAVNEVSERRPHLLWVAQILTQCRNFILTLLY